MVNKVVAQEYHCLCRKVHLIDRELTGRLFSDREMHLSHVSP